MMMKQTAAQNRRKRSQRIFYAAIRLKKFRVLCLFHLLLSSYPRPSAPKTGRNILPEAKKKTRVHICDRELPFVCGFGCSAVLVGLGGIISILITRCSVADETDSMGSTSLTNERNINCHYRFHLSMLEDLP